MYSNEVVLFIYELHNNNIKIWAEDKELKLFVPTGISLSEENKNYIKQNKSEILDCLIAHKIYSKENNTLILRNKLNNQELSFAQARLWFIDQYENGNNAYNIPMIFKLASSINVKTLEKSLKSIIERHEVLRSLIKQNSEGDAYQTILNSNEYTVDIAKIKLNNQFELDEKLREAINYTFNLSIELPVKIYLYEVKDNKYLAIIIHHIAFDGWSIEIFLKELQEYYDYYSDQIEGLESKLCLDTLNIQYKDFALWQRYYLSNSVVKKELDFWKTKLEDYVPLNLITNKIRPKKIDYQGQNHYFEIDELTSESLRLIAKDLKVSLYSLLLSAYYLMLRVYSNQNDILIGTPVANRNYSEIEPLIGFFVNSLALRSQLNPNDTLYKYIQSVGQEVISAQLHQDLPFEKLVEELNIEHDTSRHPIFQVMFSVQNFGEKTDSSSILEIYRPKKDLYNVAKFDLSTFIDDSNSSLKGNINYATSLYTEETIKELARTYNIILRQFSESKDQLNSIKISDLQYLDSTQYNKIVKEWNDTDKSYPSDKTIHCLFEEQALKTPNNVALIFKNVKLSYRDINEKSNQLAHYLKEKYNIMPDDLVTLCLDRSEYTLISILAILKAGGAYVPMDPEYPNERINYIVEDTRTKIVITNEAYAHKFKNSVLVEKLDLSSQETSNLLPISTSNNLAYVIYTSGTTGNPKGVMIEHKGVVNYIDNIKNHVFVSSKDKVDFSTNIGFDLTVTNTICALCLGAEVVIYNGKLQDIDAYKDHLLKNEINVIKLVPSYFELLIDILAKSKVNKIILGGEKLNSYLLDKLKNELQGKTDLIIYDEYGPTETTVGACISNIYPGNNFNIGKTYDNTKAYILNDDLKALPIGAIGELYIGGVGLARGYLNLPELTIERFIDIPFNTKDKLYKTGDLVRWLPDGNLDYIGRNDFQVKIRGFRIELGEIESVLSSYENIKQSIVIDKEYENGNKYLIAYYVSNNELDQSEIFKYLENKLPEYMVPSILIFLNKLPITLNGKLNRRMLPSPELGSDQGSYIAPRNKVEEQLCDVWADTLKIDKSKVGVRDSFFKLGGNSLLAIKLSSRINKVLNLNCTVAIIFKYNTIEKQQNYLKNILQSEYLITRSEVNKPEEQLLSFAQKRMWFISQYEENKSIYNVPMIFKLANYTSIDTLKKSIRAIIERHELLRTLIKIDEKGNSYQRVFSPSEYVFDIKTIKIKNYQNLDQEFRNAANYSFNLSEEFPIKVSFYQFKDINYISLVIHHIASDGWSIDILLKELHEYYNYYQNKSEGLSYKLDLAELNIQYKDFALWQYNYLSGKKLQNELEYWRNKLQNIEVLNLITDKPRPRNIDYLGKDRCFELGEKISNELRDIAKNYNVSLYSLLLSAYYLMIKVYSNQNDIIVITPAANRHYQEIENLIGFFVNLLPLRIKIKEDYLLKEFIQAVGNEVIAAQIHQDLPFEKLIEELQLANDNSRHQISQVIFGMQDFGKEIIENSNILEPYKPKDSIYNVAKFDLGMFLDDSQTKLIGNFNYATALYTEETIDRFIDTYIQILEQLVQKSDNFRIADLNYLNQDQYNLIIEEKNITERGFLKHKMIHQLFEDQERKTPNNIALICKNSQLSYKELNNKSNQLAHYLRKHYNIQANHLVAVFLDRSEYMIISILAILKSGGAYVAIDPNFPEERINYILKDIDTNLILTNNRYQQMFKNISSKANVLVVDEESMRYQVQPISNLEQLATSKDLAYIVYTSGTTGFPKGVMIKHEGLVNLAIMQAHEFGLSNNVVKNCLSYANFVFDAFASEIYTSLSHGHILHLIDDVIRYDIDLLSSYIKNNSIDIATIPPALLDDKNILQLETLIVAGEKANKKILDLYCENNTKVINAYGPSEYTVCASLKHYHYEKSSNIGTPIANTKLYILNNNLVPLPVGAVGELYIGGVGLAKGYLNKPDLTTEKFINNPFIKGKKLYKTGDLVRWLSNGDLEYIGRNDSQVKINGLRIEIGEIESQLTNYNGIVQSIAIVKEHEDGRKFLIAYYVADNKLNKEKILSYLSTKLPDYMIPTNLIHIKNFPLTTNGKIDIKALPNPECNINQNGYVAPRNELEVKICKIWSEVLHVSEDSVGIRDDFFKAGGDSIISIQMSSRLRKNLGLKISIKDIFNYKTIEKIIDNILCHSVNNIRTISEQGTLKGEVALLPIQEWFFNNNYTVPQYWNQSFIVKTPPLDVIKLKSCLDKLYKYHDSFKLRFKTDVPFYNPGDTTQYYESKAKKSLDLHVLDISKEPLLKNKFNEWQSSFNLEEGPLCCVAYLYGYADGSSRIFFALHHLIVDAVSWKILVEDLEYLYNGKELGEKATSYRQWGEALHRYSNKYTNEKEYWHNILADYNKEKISEFSVWKSSSTSKIIKIDSQITQNLLKKSHYAFNTQINDILLTALAYSLSETTKTSINHVVLEGHGREDIEDDIDITRTLGWFTTMYPVRLELNSDIASSLKEIKEYLRNVPNKGIGYGALFGYKRKDLPKISFNYLGQFDNHTDGNSWNIVNENTGIPLSKWNHDCNYISINGSVSSNILTFHISSKLDQKELNNFANSFKNHLESIITYTTNLTRGYLTVSDVNKLVTQEFLDKLQKEKEIEAIYLANSLQQGFIYHALHQSGLDDSYIVQSLWEYQTFINIEKLKQAWEYAQKKYSTLRLRFNWEDKLIQIIDKDAEIDWRYIDLCSSIDQESEIKKIQESDRLEQYNLEKSNLFRVYIIKKSNTLYTCLFSSHHAILDGWSNSILLNYVHEVYLDLVDNKKIIFQPDNSYDDAQLYLQEYLNSNEQYWQDYLLSLEDENDLNGLLTKSKRGINLNEYRNVLEPKEQEIIINNEIYYNLKKLCKNEGITLNAILQYVWHKILSIQGNTNQTIVGTTVSGRNLPLNNIEDSVGLYINTLPLIVTHDCDIVIELIRSIGENINEINERSNQNLANLSKNADRLFDSLFIYENYPVSNDINGINNKLKLIFKKGIEKLDYPLVVIAYENKDSTIFKLQYAGELFNADIITQLLSTVQILIEQISNNPKIKESDLQYLSQIEYNKIIKEWNNTDKAIAYDKTIVELFELQVIKTPDKIALVYEDKMFTYAELNKRANQLAHYLCRNYNIIPETLVALHLDRNEYTLIAILAVLKTGAAYVPMDPNYPNERLQYILEDTKTKIILSNEKYKNKFKKSIAVDKVDLSQELDINLLSIINSNNLAYILYTSGTTGNPKGVMIEHKSVVNTVLSLNNVYDFSKFNKVTAFSTYVFDISVSEFFVPLFRGGELHLLSETCKTDASLISNYILDNKINYVYLPAALLSTLPRIEYKSLIAIIYGGEPCDVNAGTYWSNNCKLYNYYGPTEATIYATGKKIENGDVNSIGTPMNNVKTYILTSNFQPIPVGGIGELYIGGEGLARGYLNRPDLTEKSFINNMFKDKTKLYKTGDLVRWLPNGEIEYIGRNDFQVKIRGFRIELGEIEAALIEFEKINQVVVITTKHENGTTYIIAYYVADNQLDEDKIFNYLSTKLLDYMIPDYLVYLDKIPLTINGKLDRKKLPIPILNKDKNNYYGPRNYTDRKIRNIFSKILKIEEASISIKDDFFKIGGNSILSIKLCNLIKQELGFSISVKDIFSYKTIEKLYDNILDKKINATDIEAEKGILNGEVKLSPIQTYILKYDSLRNTNCSKLFIKNIENISIEKLEISLNKLYDHHDAFRLRYKNNIQYYDSNAKKHKLKIIDVNSENLDDIISRCHAGFNSENGLLYEVFYLHGFKNSNNKLLFILHNLIADYTSINILSKDIDTLCYGDELIVKGNSFRQWVIKTNEYYHGSYMSEKRYWDNILIDFKANEINKSLNIKDRIDIREFNLDDFYSSKLINDSNKTYNTEVDDILLTAIAYSLVEIIGKKVNHILIDNDGRNIVDLNLDLNKTLGNFSAIVPVRLELGLDIKDSLKIIKENLRILANKSAGYGVLFGYDFQELPKISFNYIKSFSSEDSEQIWKMNCNNSICNEDDHILHINTQIVNNKLRCNIISKMSNENTSRFVEIFRNKLIEIINACTEQTHREYTISDLDDFEKYVLLNQEVNTHSKLFIFPPSEGGAENYFNNIVPHLLGKELELVLFNNYYYHLRNKIHPNKLNYMTYEKAANSYISYIKSLQSKGPYDLLGWSYGAMLVFEIARQLEASGDEVRNIILIDGLFEYKKFIQETNQELLQGEDFYYNYSPLVNFNNKNIEITLFKAMEIDILQQLNQDMNDLALKKHLRSKYYVEKTKANHLDEVLKDYKLNIIAMNSGHESWVHNKIEVEKICKKILSLFDNIKKDI